ncbi:MAG: alpha/beta hydrolase [Saprospiraceae bacterium]|nr:alpha/beta hydrolase [Saprospiraceae bacterium]
MKPESARAQQHKEDTIRNDIVYGHSKGVELKFDLIQPKDVTGPFPAILFFHGGGWQAGDKWHGHHWIRMFADLGFVGISVGYRFAPEFAWPAQVQDAKAAVRFLRKNAIELNIDPNRIGVMGESAGAYLALMVGSTGGIDELEGDGGSPDFSSRVQAVVSYFGASDFTQTRAKLSAQVEEEVMQYYKKPLSEVMADFIGSPNPDESTLQKMSVLTYIDGTDPPVLIFQGDNDPFVSVSQAEGLANALEKVNVRHELVMVIGGGHGWTGDLKKKNRYSNGRILSTRINAKEMNTRLTKFKLKTGISYGNSHLDIENPETTLLKFKVAEMVVFM